MKNRYLLSLLGAALCVAAPSVVRAQNLLINPSFELGDYAPVIANSYVRLSAGSSNLTGWTIGGAGIDWHQNSSEIKSAADGTRVIDLNLQGGGLSDTGTISQSFDTVAGEIYSLTFTLAGPSGATNPRQVRVNIAGIEEIFSQPSSSNLALVWGEKELSFTATATTTLLQFSSVSGSGVWGPFLDKVAVVPVPEPFAATWLLVGGTAVALLRRNRVLVRTCNG